MLITQGPALFLHFDSGAVGTPRAQGRWQTVASESAQFSKAVPQISPWQFSLARLLAHPPPSQPPHVSVNRLHLLLVVSISRRLGGLLCKRRKCGLDQWESWDGIILSPVHFIIVFAPPQSNNPSEWGPSPRGR